MNETDNSENPPTSISDEIQKLKVHYNETMQEYEKVKIKDDPITLESPVPTIYSKTEIQDFDVSDNPPTPQ
eukprot:UN02702